MLIQDILEKESIEIHFQPIVSVRRQRVFGLEALLRGFYNSKEVSPYILFKEAKEQGLALSLDKLARRTALKKFADIHKKFPDIILFLNFESTLIDENFSGKEFDFQDKCKALGIPPKNIALEVKEDEISSNEGLNKFCNLYRDLGFNIAIDDFGVGNSSFDRLSIVKPDIIKVDRSILQDIHKNHIKQEILKAITNMSKNIGARVLAEGVEKKEEILEAMTMGISTYQGFWFEKPKNIFENTLQEKILHIANETKVNKVKTIEKREKILGDAEKISDGIFEALSLNMENLNRDLLKLHDSIEAIYIIDSNSAKQIGETIIDSDVKSMYEPTKSGDDHSFSDYYYITKGSERGVSLTPLYVSYASGNMCRTFAKRYKVGCDSILCIDIKS